MSEFEFKPAIRFDKVLHIALVGQAGAGKTLQSLLLAAGLAKGDWSKIFCIDTEHGSAALYASDERFGVGQFMHMELDPPYSPQRYIKAIAAAVRAGAKVVVIDSLTHAWSGEGGVLDMVDRASGANKFTSGWSKATPEQNALIEAILKAPCHTITTMRSKMEYILVEENGRQVPKRVGLKPVQRSDAEYEFSIVLDIDRDSHLATAIKDRTPLVGDGRVSVDQALGERALAWLGGDNVGDNSGWVPPAPIIDAGRAPEPTRAPRNGDGAQTQSKAPAPAEPAKPAPPAHPWQDTSKPLPECRNLLYAVAVAEWGYADVDDVRSAIKAAGRWTGENPIPNHAALDAIAEYLQHRPDPVIIPS